MVSVTMPIDPPAPPSCDGTSIVIFAGGHDQLAQIKAYYATHFHPSQMETFAQMVLEKGHGARTPNGVKRADGMIVPETWQACGRRLYGDRFIAVMERAVTRYIAEHGQRPAPMLPEPGAPPAHVLEEIPEPEF